MQKKLYWDYTSTHFINVLIIKILEMYFEIFYLTEHFILKIYFITCFYEIRNS